MGTQICSISPQKGGVTPLEFASALWKTRQSRNLANSSEELI